LPVRKTSFAFSLAEIKAKDNNADAYWLQLKESEKPIDDDFPERSSLEYFFDDDVEVEFLDEQGKKLSSETGNKAFKVHENYRKAEEKQIVLTDKGKLILPPKETKSLKLKANTYQLERQLDALYALMNAPLPHHQALVRALLKRKVDSPNGFWGEFPAIEEPEWSVLTQHERAGTDNQREFVRKALASPDFCILEGPPGSGKTTAILELIVQLAKQGKRVLLCASTHVAIDNVLERLIADSKLMDFILPIRIGDQARVQENVKDWQLGNIKNKEESNKLYRDEALLLEAANLVCGTTLGILQHPLIKDSPKNRPRQPVFDCLIIDECSKTTFAEFLVPALYARKWILVGDVRQLSPYVESDWLIANLENLNKKTGARLLSNCQKSYNRRV
jgi:superfamily I DNA and/or RNA helicase